MNESSHWLLFIGRFHVLLVHLPIGFVVLLATLEGLARTGRFRGANQASGCMLAALVPAAVLSAACGWMLATEGGYDPGLLWVHRVMGTVTAALCVLMALLHRWGAEWAYRVTLAMALAAIVVTGHYGGSLTHGTDYLTRYAPQALRDFLGQTDSPRHSDARPPAPKPHLVFADVMAPLFHERCGACHNEKKHKGGLSVDSLESLLRGGEHGPVLIAGRAGESPALQRMLLPLEEDDHMPPSGKPQPTADEIALVRWWIDARLPVNEPLEELHPPAELVRAAWGWATNHASTRP
jgi:hypothetical protein